MLFGAAGGRWQVVCAASLDACIAQNVAALAGRDLPPWVRPWVQVPLDEEV